MKYASNSGCRSSKTGANSYQIYSSMRDVRIHWDAIKPEKVRAVNHDQLAGLQMADAVASSHFFAVNLTQYGEVEDRYFNILRSTIYRHPKSGELGYGLTFGRVA